MKRFIVMLAAIAMISALAVTAAAEYVACVNPGEEHAMSGWTKISDNGDGTSVYERVCSKCDYHQKGFAGTNSDPAAGDGVATTRSVPENMAVTTSLELGTPVASNPATGARA